MKALKKAGKVSPTPFDDQEAEDLSAGICDQFVKGPDPAWRKGLSKDQMQKMPDFFQKRYGEEWETGFA